MIGVIIAALQRGLAGTLGKDLLSVTKVDEVNSRRRGLTNKKVSNQKLKLELGYQFKYPDFRKGDAAEIQGLQEMGGSK